MTENEHKSWRWVVALVRLGFGIALFVAVFVWFVPVPSDIASRVVPWVPGAAIGLLATTVGTGLTAWRWRLLHEGLGTHSLPYRVYFRAFAITRLLAQFLPASVVELVGRSMSLRAAGSRSGWAATGGVLVLERVLDVLLPLFVFGWLIAAHDLGSRVQWVGSLVIALSCVPLAPWILGPLARLGSRLATHVAPHPSRAEPRLSSALSMWIGLLGLGRFFAVLVQFWGLGAAVGVAVPPLRLVAASTVAQLATIIAVTPGGLGFQEGGWAAGLTWQGIEAPEVGLFALAVRIGMILNFALLAGSGAVWVFLRPFTVSDEGPPTTPVEARPFGTSTSGLAPRPNPWKS